LKYRDKVYFMEENKMEKEISNTFVSKSRFELNTIIIKEMTLFENCFSFILLRFRIILQRNIFIVDGRTYFKTRKFCSFFLSLFFYLEIWLLNVFPRENTLHFVGHDNIFKTKKIYAFTNVYKNWALKTDGQEFNRAR
jgi:hypothetical protein